jgi:AbiEi antitoxin C-terminal domain
MAEREVLMERRVPTWAAGLVARLTQDRPPVVTVDDIAEYLAEFDDPRDPGSTVRSLVALDWLTATHIKGTWAFHPPGETDALDPYLDLRAWARKEPSARFALAGEATAWHLGYLDRRFAGPIAIWVPEGRRPPKGIRSLVSIVRIGWGADAVLGPRSKFLADKRLDRTMWATGIPALGPEALLVQLAVRPLSFAPWADLAAHFETFAHDCEPTRVVELIDGQTASAWQRASYLLHTGGNDAGAEHVAGHKSRDARLVHARLGAGAGGVHVARYGVTDTVLAPLLAQVGKA